MDNQASEILFRFDFRNLLALKEERVRRPIRQEALAIQREMGTLASAPFSPERDQITRLVSQFNVGALICMQAGSVDHASAICLRAIQLCDTEFESTGVTHWLSAGLQSFINLARLEAARGDVHSGISVLRTLFESASVGGNATVYGQIFRGRELLANEETGKIAKQLTANTYLKDSIRLLLWSQRCEELLTFLGSVQTMPVYQDSHFQLVVAEARIRALIQGKHYQDALTLASALKALLASAPSPQPAVLLLIAHLYLDLDRYDLAERVISTVSGYYDAWCTAGASALERRKFKYQLALCWLRCKQPARCVIEATESWRLSQILDDEPAAIRALTLRLAAESTLPDPTSAISNNHSRSADLLDVLQRTQYLAEAALSLFILAKSNEPSRFLPIEPSACLLEVLRNAKRLRTIDGAVLSALAVAELAEIQPDSMRSGRPLLRMCKWSADLHRVSQCLMAASIAAPPPALAACGA